MTKKSAEIEVGAEREASECSDLLSYAIAGKSDIFVAAECARRLGKETEAAGKDTFTMGDIRRIKRDLYEER